MSLATGETIASISLHPYRNPLPPENDLPGPGLVLVSNGTLYVATHSALFAYKLNALGNRPRTLYSDLADLPMLIDGRYVSIREGTPRNVRRAAILDAHNRMRTIWSDTNGPFFPTFPRGPTQELLSVFNGRARSLTVDASCGIGAMSERYAFMACGNLDIASNAHLGAPPKALKSARGTLLPVSIAVYPVF